MNNSTPFKMIDKKTFKTRTGKEGFTFWDGVSYSSWGQKMFRIHCPDCMTSDNEKIRGYAINYKFLVSISNLNRDTLPCGCSSRIEKLCCTYSEDFLYNHEFTFKDSRITIKESFTKDNISYRYFECSVCSIDEEFYPERFYTPSYKIIKGVVNCGCSSNYRYSEEQRFLQCKREAEKKGLSFKGFKGEYKNKKTKCILSCQEHGIWDSCSIDNFLRGRGCPECAQLKRNSTQGNRNGFYKERGSARDYLYIVKFEDYIKIGRSFDPKDRLRGLKSSANIDYLPEILEVFVSDHKNIYEVEQNVHKYLRLKGYYYKSGWTKESFQLESLEECLNYLCKSCGLERVTL